MTTYHKIDTLFNRDQDHKVIEGAWRTREFDYLSDASWEWTEKLDGMNIRVMFFGDTPHFAGRTDNAQLRPDLFQHLGEHFTQASLSAIFSKNTILYGEGIGPKIQNGGLYCDDHRFVLFDVYIDGVWLDRCDVDDVAKKLGVSSAPVAFYGTPKEAARLVRDAGLMSMLAKGIVNMEGLVGRPCVELLDKNRRRVIAKIKARDFK